jgi:hypothetical protein
MSASRRKRAAGGWSDGAVEIVMTRAPHPIVENGAVVVARSRARFDLYDITATRHAASIFTHAHACRHDSDIDAAIN